MSWDEVKKINSDMFVPLDERATYIAGIIPRNKLLKSAGHSKSAFYGNENTTILSIKGSGKILSMSAYAEVGASSEMTVNIDDGQKIFTFISNNSISKLEIDMNSIYSTLDITPVNILITNGKTFKINDVIDFKHSLLVTDKISASSYVKFSNGIDYILD